MKPFLGTLLTLALAGTPSLIAPAPAMASVAAVADGQAVIDANKKLAERIAATPAGKPLPMLSNDGAALVRAAYDAPAIRAVPLEDAETLGHICESLGASITAYGNAMSTEAGGDAAKMNAATVRLQSEFALATVASVVCAQRGFRSIDGLIAPLGPDVLKQVAPALELMRTGYKMILEGSLEFLAIPGISPANQDMITAALNEDSGVIAASYPAAERRERAKAVRDATGRAPARLRPALERVARSFDAPDCNNICKAAGN